MRRGYPCGQAPAPKALYSSAQHWRRNPIAPMRTYALTTQGHASAQLYRDEPSGPVAAQCSAGQPLGSTVAIHESSRGSYAAIREQGLLASTRLQLSARMPRASSESSRAVSIWCRCRATPAASMSEVITSSTCSGWRAPEDASPDMIALRASWVAISTVSVSSFVWGEHYAFTGSWLPGIVASAAQRCRTARFHGCQR